MSLTFSSKNSQIAREQDQSHNVEQPTTTKSAGLAHDINQLQRLPTQQARQNLFSDLQRQQGNAYVSRVAANAKPKPAAQAGGAEAGEKSFAGQDSVVKISGSGKVTHGKITNSIVHIRANGGPIKLGNITNSVVQATTRHPGGSLTAGNITNKNTKNLMKNSIALGGGDPAPIGQSKKGGDTVVVSDLTDSGTIAVGTHINTSTSDDSVSISDANATLVATRGKKVYSVQTTVLADKKA